MRLAFRFVALTLVVVAGLLFLFSSSINQTYSQYLGQSRSSDTEASATDQANRFRDDPVSGGVFRLYEEEEFVSSDRRSAMSGHQAHDYDVPKEVYVYPRPDDKTKAKAALIMLARNSDLDDAIGSVTKLERSFNSKYRYPWIFINNEPFTQNFRRRMKEAIGEGEVRFEIVPWDHWSVPTDIDPVRLTEGFDHMEDENVNYSHLLSYRQMCRWNSGKFYHHPALKDLDYYWRVEPGVEFFCDVDYDVFRFMELNDKVYGFVISLRDAPQTIESLWPTVETFMEKHPKYLHVNNSLEWLKERSSDFHFARSHGYSTCHFWTNFEIAKLSVWRDAKYEAFFDHLDKTGNFFYERWGDAPVHSVALGLFEDKHRIHFFDDIGYRHIPYWNCPKRRGCDGCNYDFTDGHDIDDQDCKPIWFDNLRKPSLRYERIFDT